MHTRARVVAVAATLILAAAPVLVAAPSGAAAAPARATYRLDYQPLPNGTKAVMRWNPCRAHTYKVNLASVPSKSKKAMLAETHAAMRLLAAKTGMSFKYKGATREVPRNGSSTKQSADIVIAYTTPSKTNYSLSGPTAGMGGYSGISKGGNVGGKTTYTTAITKGFLVVDTPDALQYFEAGFGKGARRGNLLLHELGHVVGLGHVNNGALLMNPAVTSLTPNGYAAGDRAGLAKVGRRAGCISGL